MTKRKRRRTKITTKEIKRALITQCATRFVCRYACDEVHSMDVAMLRNTVIYAGRSGIISVMIM